MEATEPRNILTEQTQKNKSNKINSRERKKENKLEREIKKKLLISYNGAI